VPTGANRCQQVPTGANRCQQVPTGANRCQQVPKRHLSLLSFGAGPIDYGLSTPLRGRSAVAPRGRFPASPGRTIRRWTLESGRRISQGRSPPGSCDAPGARARLVHRVEWLLGIRCAVGEPRSLSMQCGHCFLRPICRRARSDQLIRSAVDQTPAASCLRWTRWRLSAASGPPSAVSG
jgi:hypothetical protein